MTAILPFFILQNLEFAYDNGKFTIFYKKWLAVSCDG